MATDPNANEPDREEVDDESAPETIEPTEGEAHDNAIHVKRD